MLGKVIQRKGYAIFKLNSHNVWVRYPGRAMRIAVHSDGQPWIISTSKKVFRYTRAGWVSVKAPKARLLVNGPEGSLYLLDNVLQKSGFGIWKWNGKKFL